MFCGGKHKDVIAPKTLLHCYYFSPGADYLAHPITKPHEL